MREIPKPFEVYRHFKGNMYQVLTIATDSEDEKPVVVYQALYGEYKVYVRALDSFMSLVDRDKYPYVEQRYRFECIRSAVSQTYTENAGLPVKNIPNKSQQMAELQKNVEPQKVVELQSVVQPQKVIEPQSVVQSQKGIEPQKVVEPQSVVQPQKVIEPQRVVQPQKVEEPERSQQSQKVISDTQELGLDPLIVEYLDAKTVEQRINILTSAHHRITDDLIDVMAACSDIEVEKGPVEERYQSLKNCLLTKQKFEKVRLF